jgi:hypothetical protein
MVHFAHPPDGPDPSLDDEFPVGDGTVETSALVECPYCGAVVEVGVDPGGGEEQRYVEDCEVCCRPWNVTVRWHGGLPHVDVRTEDEI